MTEKTETPKKLLAFVKNYILTFSYSPIFLSTIFFALIWALQYVIYSLIAGCWTPEKLPIIIGVATIVTHIIIIYILRNIFIMRPPLERLLFDLWEPTTVACGILGQDKKFQIINGPTWIKGIKYVIQWDESFKRRIDTEVRLSIKHQKATAKIPIKLSFEVTSWNKLNLLLATANPENKITSSVRDGVRYFNLEDILIAGFNAINRDNINDMSAILEKYMEGMMPTPKFLNDITESLVDPEEIFGAKVKTTITVKEPIFSATK